MTKVIINSNRNRISVAQTNNIVANVKFSPIGGGNSAAGGAAVYLNGVLVLPGANTDYLSSNTINVTATANGTKLADVGFSANLTAIANYIKSSTNTADLYVSDAPPSSPRANLDLWWNSNTGSLKIYYADPGGSQWVDATPPYASNVSGGSGGEPIGTAAYAQANAAYAQANTALSDALVAYGQANSAYAQANLAYTAANNALAGGSTFPTANIANVNVGGVAIITTNTVTTTANATPVVIDSFLASAYNVVKYLVQVTTAAGIQCTEVLCMQNGVNTYMTEYGTLLTGAPLGTFSSTLSGSTYQFIFTPINPTAAINYIKVMREAIVT